MKTSKPTKTELEINDYIMANKGISYYDVLIFAYDNDLDKWIDLLKHTKYKKALSDTLRDIQIELGMFTVRLDEQLKLCHEAEIRYYHRHIAKFAELYALQEIALYFSSCISFCSSCWPTSIIL